jgi:hypothetical protein
VQLADRDLPPGCSAARTIARATRSGEATGGTGRIACPVQFVACRKIGVSIEPGSTVQTEMRRSLFSSWRSTSEKPRTPNLRVA